MQGRERGRDLLDVTVGHQTHFTDFKGHCPTGMLAVPDAVHAQDFARHQKSGDLVPLLLVRQQGFEKTAAHRIQSVKCLADIKEGFPALQATPGWKPFIQRVEFADIQRWWVTDFVHVTVHALGL